jgi:hypothetical protein
MPHAHTHAEASLGVLRGATTHPVAGSLDRAQLRLRSTARSRRPPPARTPARSVFFFPASPGHRRLLCRFCACAMHSPCGTNCACANSCSLTPAAPGEWFRRQCAAGPSDAARLAASSATTSPFDPRLDPVRAALRPRCGPATRCCTSAADLDPRQSTAPPGRGH